MNAEILEKYYLMVKACMEFLNDAACDESVQEECRKEYHLASEIYDTAESRFFLGVFNRRPETEEDMDLFFTALKMSNTVAELKEKMKINPEQ